MLGDVEDVVEDELPWQSGGEKTLECRVFHMEAAGAMLRIAQGGPPDAAVWAAGAGSVVWEAAEATVAFLDASFAKSGGLVGKTVCELGAGTGVCGIACAALGAKAILTDLPAALPLAQRNASSSEWSERLDVRALDWTTPMADGGDCAADLVLACDTVYQPKLYPALASVIASLGAPCILSWRERGKQESELLDLLRREGAFTVEVMSHPHDAGVTIVRATPRARPPPQAALRAVGAEEAEAAEAAETEAAEAAAAAAAAAAETADAKMEEEEDAVPGEWAALICMSRAKPLKDALKARGSSIRTCTCMHLLIDLHEPRQAAEGRRAAIYAHAHMHMLICTCLYMH